jgi:hypothetical protein
MNYFPKTSNLSLEQYSKSITRRFHISKEDKIISIGSCFSSEIKHYLVSNGYNYLQEESDKNIWLDIWPGDRGRHKSHYASCAWERVYSTHNIRQVFAAAMGVEHKDRILETDRGVFDLMRSRVLYPDIKVAKEDIKDHTAITLKLITSADVIIITLGVNEVWSIDGFYIAGSPAGLRCPGSYQLESVSVKANESNLIYVCQLLKAVNPKIKIIFAVTPIHLKASFRTDVDVVSASCYGKSVLRVAVDNVVRDNNEISYFPSYEIATILFQMMGGVAYDHDHHITPKCVDAIMHVFEMGYCRD